MRVIVMTATLALATAAGAYPISPVFLWQLTHEAELIVLAEVESVRLEGSGGDDLRDAPSSTAIPSHRLGPSIARLRVRETWKGSPRDSVEVAYNSAYICPSPPSFDAGETVAAFLVREGSLWRVVALSYGVRHLAPDAIGATRARVREAVALQAGGRVTVARRVEWLTACCEHPATRHDALRELAPRVGWFDRAYDRVEGRASYAARLTADQRLRLLAAFLADPPDVHSLPLIVHALKEQPSEELDSQLVRTIEEALLDPDSRWALEDAMAAVAVRLRVPRARSRFESLHSLRARGDDGEAPLADFQLAWDTALAERPHAPAARR